MKTIEEIRAALAQAKTDSERAALVAELEQAISARGDEKPSEVEQHRAAVAELASQRATLVGEIEALVTGAVDDKGEAREYTVEEAEKRGELKARLAQVEEQHSAREDQFREAEKQARDKHMSDQVAQMRKEMGLGEQPANSQGGGLAVLSEPRTYEKGNGRSYLLDFALTHSPLGQGMGARSVQARERLFRHGHENHVVGLEVDERIGRMDSEGREKAFRTRDGYFLKQMIETHNQRDQNRGPVADLGITYRALSTAATAGGEFVPPMYLTEEWIVYARPGRVLADLQHNEPLPDGTMSINIPKVTGGTSAGTQGIQNTLVSNTDLQTQFVTFPVVTKAGMQVISLQLLERSPISFDEVVGRDLALAYAQNLNEAVGSGTGTAEGGGTDIVGILNTTGINVVTWTQASPTLKGLYGRIGTGKVKVAEGRKLPATDQVMTSSCWEWIDQTFDTSERPVVVPQYNGPFNAVVEGPDSALAQGTIGRKMQELGTYVDLTLPTKEGVGKNQDVLIGGRFDENYLYESPITMRMLPQTYGAQLSNLMQLYGYAAFTAARYAVANFVITGTGMSTSNRTFNS